MEELLTKKTHTVVYVMQIPSQTDVFLPLFPDERQKQVANVSNADVKAQKYHAWRLLCYALQKYVGVPVEQIIFSVTGQKWTCAECNFSLSHTNGYVAVGLSTLPVGVDVECVSPRFTPKLLERIACSEERDVFPSEGNIAALWTAKEAAFKQISDGTCAFIPSKLPVNGADVSVYKIDSLVVSVATPSPIDLFFVHSDSNGNYLERSVSATKVDVFKH